MKQPITAFIVYSFLSLNSAWANTESTVETNGFQSTETIHNLVENYIKQKVYQQLFEPVIHIRKLSNNLQLAACQTELELKDNRHDRIAGRMTIRVQCHQPKWQVFVPATVDGKLPLVVSAKAILKRAVIKEDDVTQILVSYNRVPIGALVKTDKAIGMRTKRAIGPNQPIKVRDLDPPYWVFKNKEVNVITKIGEVEVKTKAIALKSGVQDEQVPVKNITSKKVVNGIVIAPNTVIVP